MILKTKLDDIKKAVVVGGPIPQVFKTLGLYVKKLVFGEKFRSSEKNLSLLRQADFFLR